MTIQATEKIIFDNKKYELLSYPLDPFLKELDVKPVPTNSTCWSGYICEWGLVNNVLYLNKIKMKYKPEDEKKLMPLLLLDEVILQAFWFTGELRVALVEPTYYHTSYQPFYSKEMVLKVENGLIMNHKIVENEVPEIEDNGLPF